MRRDLLALTDDALAALANRGIVKRSVRDVADGKGPVLVEDEGTVTATFGDGTTVVIPPDATIEQGRCTCPASDLCRHRVMVVVAYRTAHDDTSSVDNSSADTSSVDTGLASPAVSGSAVEWWSPAVFTDDDLAAHVGKRAMAEANKALRTGYRARVRRPTEADPVPTVELVSCTVRFLVPGNLGYATVDAARGERLDAIALAVWACRAADEVDADILSLDVQVGGSATTATASSGIEPAFPLLDGLLRHGVVGAGSEVSTEFARVRRLLDEGNLRWPIDALDDLAAQVDAYRTRDSRYAPTVAAGLVAELVARHRCVARGGASLAVQVLGTEETAETPLPLLRLTGIGARVTGDESSRAVEVYFAHPEAGMVLALRRQVLVSDGESPSAADLGRRKAGGARLSALASANVVTESAVRSANRVVRFGESRLAKTSVVASTGRWETLPEGILVTDLNAEGERLARLAPAVVRERIVAESMRVVAVDGVDDMYYLPGSQEFHATVRSHRGRARIVLTYTAACPGAIDALAQALGGGGGEVRYVAGHLRRHGAGIDIEPTAVVVGDGVVVPAFAPVSGERIESVPVDTDDRFAAALGEAISVSAEVVHRGSRGLPAGWPQRAERCARELRRVGLTAASVALDDLVNVVRAGGPGLTDCWADSHLRLLLTFEQI